MKAAGAGAVLLLALLLLPGCGANGGGQTVRVFASASLAEPFSALEAAFERRHDGVDVDVQLAGTPVLVAQLERGARADVFASADEESMGRAVSLRGTATSPKVFATNTLTLVVSRGNPKGVAGFADLAREELVVALAAEEVPAGRYARAALRRAGAVARADTHEPSVKAIVTKVALGEVDVGVVYRTDVLAAGGRVHGVALPAEHNVDARLMVAALRGAPEAATAFVDFLFSDEGQGVLATAGFGPPPRRLSP